MTFKDVKKINKTFILGEKIGEPFLDLARFQKNFNSVDEQILFFRGITKNRYPSFYTVSHSENALGDSSDKDKSFFVANGFNPYFNGHAPLWVYGTENPKLLELYKKNFNNSMPIGFKQNLGKKLEGKYSPEERLDAYLYSGILIKTTIDEVLKRPDYSFTYGHKDPIAEYLRTLGEIEKVKTVYEIPLAKHSGEPLFLCMSLGLPVFRDPINGIWLDFQSHTNECFSYVDKEMIDGHFREFSELAINLKQGNVSFV